MKDVLRRVLRFLGLVTLNEFERVTAKMYHDGFAAGYAANVEQWR